MPERATKKRAAKAKRQGKSPSTQAGEYVREEIHHVREGKHGARSPEQAIAIGLSKARRAGVNLPPPEEGPSDTRRQAKRDLAMGRKTSKRTSKARSRGSKKALGRGGGATVSRKALSRHAKKAASKRTKTERSASARKAARTKGPAKRSAAAKKGARTRKRKG